MRSVARTAVLCASLAMAAPAVAYNAGDLQRVRSGDDCTGCDLSGADLSAIDIYGDLSGANLAGANLAGSLVAGGFMDHANLRGADLTGASLAGIIVYGANLRGAKLKGANLRDTVFDGSNLDGADLSGADVEDADFAGASLKGTIVSGTDMAAAFGADLSAVIDRSPAPAPTPAPAPAPTPVARGGNDRLSLGSVFLVASSFCPAGTAEADGRSVTVADNQALASLYGDSYGGAWPQALGLPDLRPQVPLPGMRYCVVTYGSYPARN